MRNRITTTAATAAVTAALAVSGLAAPADAEAPSQRTGNRSLATVLAADGHRFDHNWGDFDILDKAVSTVLKEKPGSPVKILTQGKKRLTAFLPTDRAFRVLVRSLTGTAPKTEKAAFTKLAGVADVDTIETVLLYHVVPGATITKRAALRADGARLTTAQGGVVTVRVKGDKVFLRDADRDARNPRVVAFDINKGNKQIGHAINRVLRPLDL
jgi:uncharacterized surface protein with fasciclin (FAS1) repeats